MGTLCSFGVEQREEELDFWENKVSGILFYLNKFNSEKKDLEAKEFPSNDYTS